MSEYTLELNEVIEILKANDKTLFDFEYDLPEFMNKEELQNQFISQYYFREIGLETITRFLQRFQNAWLKTLKEYDIKFKLVQENLDATSALNTYVDNLQDTNTFKATPMSSMQEGRNYNTSVTDVVGHHYGYNGKNNLFKNVNDVLNEHNEVVKNFINEFDYLFMGVL